LRLDVAQAWVLASPLESDVTAAGRLNPASTLPRQELGILYFFKGGSLMMLQMMMGAKVYETSSFKQAMDSNYYPLESMKKSVDILTNSQNIDIATMEFGQYQPILAPQQINPSGPKTWLQNVGRARVQLNAQANDQQVCKDDPTVPLTKCARLDACIRKCFNSDPPICMQVNVTQKAKDAPDPALHDIILEWEYGAGGDVPTLLNLTMVCPAY
jgi:hypothetical protein